jgi:hypothetical protein
MHQGVRECETNVVFVLCIPAAILGGLGGFQRRQPNDGLPNGLRAKVPRLT